MHNEIPTEDDIRVVLEETPDTLFLTISRRACGYLNDIAQQTLFQHEDPLDIIPADPESNPLNFRGAKMIGHDPAPLRVFAGMRVTLTKNKNKKIGFVNGMGAKVLYMRMAI